MKRKEPLVSVIIPVYNTEKYIEKCLESIIEQTYENIEIIIVDNASTGNIVDICRDYQEIYPNKKIKMIRHDKNQGLLKARISGAQIATGDFISFVDSDDTISFDFYRLLVKKALDTGSEMVVAKTVYDMPDQKKLINNLALLDLACEDNQENSILELMYACEGCCHSFNLVWNKIYSKPLWDRAYKYLQEIDEHIVMCEDYIFSTIFYALGKGISFVENACYYYFKGSEAYTSPTASYEKMKKNVSDLGVVFRITEQFFKKINSYDKFKSMHSNFKKNYYLIWHRNIQNSSLKIRQKKKLHTLLNSEFNTNIKLDQVIPVETKEVYSTTLCTEAKFLLDEVKKQICDNQYKYISFDIFDTLILRPFYNPSDLFELISIELNQKMNLFINFTKLRKDAEKFARLKIRINNPGFEDITLEEIYYQFKDISGLDNELCDYLKSLEVNYEKNFCFKRKTAFELYELALKKDKKIILISDMYLSEDIIKDILDKNGYTEYFKLYLSSKERLTKHEGSLYKKAISNLNANPNEILHIGDNYNSDVIKAQKIGMTALHFPSTMDVFQGNTAIYSGKWFYSLFKQETYSRNSCALNFLGLRVMLAQIANKFFDNPYVDYNINSDFNADPRVIGYSAIGMHFVSIAFWIHEIANKYNKIHFIARDGYAIKKVYEILFPEDKNKIDYIYVSRKALIPLMITSSESFLEIENVVKYSSVSTNDIIKLLNPIITDKEVLALKKVYGEEILNDNIFTSKHQLYVFLGCLCKHAYNQENVIVYREKMRIYWNGIIGENDLTFDIGYSGRTERILSKLIGRRIDACYVHANNDSAYKSAFLNDFNIYFYYDYTPLVTGGLRELIMSENAPSCISFSLEHKEIKPVFEESNLRFPDSIILDLLQKHAIEFAYDLKENMNNMLFKLPFRYTEGSLLFEHFLNQSKQFDRWIFKIFDFEDDLDVGLQDKTIVDFWNDQTVFSNRDNNSLDNTVMYASIWKKAIYFLLFDRATLKIKAKKKLKNRPVLLSVCGVSYKLFRKIYRIFKKVN